MRRRPARAHPAPLALAALAVLATVATGCGGGSDGSAEAAADPTTTTTAPAEDPRPEGAWTFVLTTLARDDAADLEPGAAEVRLARLDPTCEAGPCDLDVTPAGADGTYLPDGVAAREAPSKEPATFTWDADAETYTRVNGPNTSSCTNVDGDVVQDAYTSTTTTTLTHRPATDDRPESLVGTYTIAVTATEAGRAEGCTPYEETGSAVGAPTGALAGTAAPDLTGTYVATEVVTEVQPPGQRPAGFVGLLGRFELAADGDGYSATGVIGDVPLAADGDGWSGRTAEVARACATTPETPKGFTSVEALEGLTPVAVTDDGEPILAGAWSLTETPTPAGDAAGCTRSSNTGYVVLVPAGSLG